MARSPKKKTKAAKADVKTRKWLTTNQKLEIIDMRDKDKKTWTQIALEKNLRESTIRTIYANRDKIKAQGKPTITG